MHQADIHTQEDTETQHRTAHTQNVELRRHGYISTKSILCVFRS